MNILKLTTAITTLVLSTSVNAALVGRLAATPGGTDYQAYYDDVADLTWLADANYAQTSGYDADGLMTWQAANNWAAQLTVGGINGWRLANTIDTGTSGCNYSTTGSTDCGFNVDTSTGELANLFYNILGNLGYYDTNGNAPQPGWGLTNITPFANVQPSYYWSATEYAPDTLAAWAFNMGYGRQAYGAKSVSYYAWAVQSGDVSAVPVPTAAWLFGSGLLSLIGLAGRKKA